MKKSDIPELVYEGKLDSVLEDLFDACVARRRLLQDRLAAKNKRTMKVGMQVVVVGNIKPRYLLGAKAKVCDPPLNYLGAQKKGMIWVDFGYKIRRYGPKVRMPASCLRLEDA